MFNVFVILVLGALVLAGNLYAQYRRFADAPIAGLAQATQIDVPIGARLPAIVGLLDERGLQPGNAYFWRLLARELGVAGKLHAGEYALDAGMTPRALLKKMAAGEVIRHRFTIVEGWTFRQLRKALDAEAGLSKDACAGAGACEGRELMARLGEADAEPEGQFLPETYSFIKGMSDVDVLRRAHEAMKKALDKLWAERAADTPLKSPYEALILASIIEKETARSEEQPQIARVFLSRLKLGMKLQTDPTVIYGMGAGYNGNIRRSDLDTDTPYNTYTRTGLPPTPIALPGKAALEAVIHPAQTDALYFVARGNGAHEFSSTLEAHNRAVARYQLNRQLHSQ
ncbi:endolytic transglycosylase MltG [Rudaea sp.]|uniref:endolytic transglycosylase MltG n=1 Tax=Rudaea sp. TaxID=2136325 RepID=UPI0039E354AD